MANRLIHTQLKKQVIQHLKYYFTQTRSEHDGFRLVAVGTALPKNGFVEKTHLCMFKVAKYIIK